jgi:hypothetical protein
MRAMKLRQAAALAGAVWYLLGPPQHRGAADFDTNAPLSKWTVIDHYDDVAACENGRMVELGHWYEKADQDPAGTKDAIKDAMMLVWLSEAKCVASDDPKRAK